MKESYADQVSSDSTERVAADQTDAPLALDERFEILKNERRRIVLRYLTEVEETVKLNELADQVTAIENDTDPDAITSEERKRVYVGLYQFHLPKMADIGVIEYDQDRGDIELTEVGANLYQEYGSESELRWDWQRVCLVLGVLGVCGVVGSVIVQAWLFGTALLAVQTALLFVLWLGNR